jgi:hypothetical protein
MNQANVTRFELIDHRTAPGDDRQIGRVYIAWPCRVELQYQDAGRTLKVFVENEAEAPDPVSPPAVTDAEWYPHGFAAQLERAPSLLSPPGSQVVLDRATVDSLAHWLRTLPKTVSTRSGLAPKGGGE